MTIRMRSALPAVVALSLIGLGHANAAMVLVYDNGPITGQGAFNINSISDSFTLSSPASLTAAQVGLWVIGGSPVGLDWSVGTTSGGSEISSGTATLANTPWGSGGYIYQSTFAINGTLGPGTYYFTLSHATASIPNGAVYWDASGGASTAYQFNGLGVIASESFQLFDDVVVPEPTSMLAGALLLLPFGFQGIRHLRDKRA